MIDINYDALANEIMPHIKRGAYLTTKSGDKTNTMIIGWGQLGVIWSKNIFTVLVRKSRFTYDLIEQSDEFTVSIPFDISDMKQAVKIAGTESGRAQDKIAKCGLELKDAKVINTPVISGCKVHYECKVVYKQPMTEPIIEQIDNTYYPNGDYHTMYFGEIVACYAE